jgi:hypothetical protein
MRKIYRYLFMCEGRLIAVKSNIPITFTPPQLMWLEREYGIKGEYEYVEV